MMGFPVEGFNGDAQLSQGDLTFSEQRFVSTYVIWMNFLPESTRKELRGRASATGKLWHAWRERTLGGEATPVIQKEASYQQHELYSFLRLPCLCLAAVLRSCFVLWEAKGKRFTVVRTSTQMAFKPQSFYWVEVRQALKPAGTVMVRSLCSYCRVCFSTDHVLQLLWQRKEVPIGTAAKNRNVHSLPFCWLVTAGLGQTCRSSKTHQRCKTWVYEKCRFFNTRRSISKQRRC